jgi:hypothetical protein
MPYIGFNSSMAFCSRAFQFDDDGDGMTEDDINELRQGALEMPFSGPPPKDQVRHRNRRHEFEDIPNVPNTRMPRLPHYFRRRLGPAAMRWLIMVARSPQAVRFTNVDWLYVWESALFANEFYRDPGHPAKAREMDRREAKLGITEDSRRALRIRLVEPPKEQPGNEEDDFDYDAL